MGWYAEHGRHSLPWRLTRDPYAILVSEVMLQQTQVDRVLPYYSAWLERWPTFAALAGAPASEVIREWRGLGYNRRALNLHRLATIIVDEHDGTLPTDAKRLRELPGIGPYTASAVQSFARDEAAAVADTNIGRVVARWVAGAASQRELSAAALRNACEGLLPAAGVRDHNLALMDLGAMICRARQPLCGECPMARHCAWRAAGFPAGEIAAKRSPKFEGTARFARGRIIDRLRESPTTVTELEAMLPEAHRPKVASYLSALERDGLARPVDGETWALPG